MSYYDKLIENDDIDLKEIEREIEMIKPEVTKLYDDINSWHRDRNARLEFLIVVHGVDEITGWSGNLANKRIAEMSQKDPKRLEQTLQRYVKDFLPKRIKIMKERKRLTRAEQRLQDRADSLDCARRMIKYSR